MKILIYGRETCGYSRQASELASTLLKHKIPIIPVSREPPGSRPPGHRTVPAVVIEVGDARFPIGGADNLQTLINSRVLEGGDKRIRNALINKIKSPTNSIQKNKMGGDMMTDMMTYGGAKSSASKKKKASSPKKAASAKPKRKPTSYAKFVKKFAADNKGLKGPSLMKKAGAKWRSMSQAEKLKF